MTGTGPQDRSSYLVHAAGHEHTYAEVLAEQLRRAPYLIASVVLHALLALLLSGIMLLSHDEEEVPSLVAAPPPPPPEVVEDPPPPPDKVIEEPVVEPEIREAELEEVEVRETLEATGDPDFHAEDPLEQMDAGNTLGLGPGPGGMPGPRGRGPGGGGGATQVAVADALQWLAEHQDPAGYWDADEFMLQDVHADRPPSTGAGNPVNDVGLTGLALLAFLGNNQTMHAGKHRHVVAGGVRWLREVQDDRGLFGEEVGNPTLYNHALATMAMGEAYVFAERTPALTPHLKRAVRVILAARNDYGAWRYGLQSNGDNDSSITGWMVFALKTAEEGGIPVDHAAYAGARAWFDQMEDPLTGRVGYAYGDGGGGPGSLPSRPVAYQDAYPAEKSEALTAVALLCRIFMTDTGEVRRWTDHPNYEMLKKNADLIRAKLPKWDEEDGSIDLYYWYYGTFAMNQWGGEHWRDWRDAIEDALLSSQRREDPGDNFYGSWDPAGVWAREEGGRVYSTAICALMLEVYYRYARVLGAR